MEQKQIQNTKLKSPEEMFEKIKKYFNSERKFIFLWTVILGVITHFLLLTNLIFSQDGLLNGIHYTAGGYETSLGRWGINFFDSLRNNIALPFLTTFISILLMGVINILLLELFEIKSKIFKLLTILSVVVSPSLCMTLLYVYTADAYLFSMFFSVFTVYSFYQIKNKKLGILLGMISFILMLSIYQSYMGITVGLIVIVSIQKLLTVENTSLAVIKDLLFKAILLILSAFLYFIITKIWIQIGGLTLSTYKGTNEISIGTILGSLTQSIKTAYIAFIKYFFADGIILNRAWKREKLFLVLFALFGMIYLAWFIKSMKSKKMSKEFLGRFLLTSLLLFMLPIALNLVILLAPGNEIYSLIATQMLLVFPLMLMILELFTEHTTFVKLLNWGVIIILSIILITYFLSIIVTYQTTQLTYQQAQNIANRVVVRMEECPGYRTGMNKLFAGIIDDSNFTKTLDLYNLAVSNSLRVSIFHATYWGQEKTWKNFMDVFCGTHIEFCKDYEYYTIVNSEEFQQMDCFPGETSVKIINDVMVVKFKENPDMPPLSQEMIERGISY